MTGWLAGCCVRPRLMLTVGISCCEIADVSFTLPPVPPAFQRGPITCSWMSLALQIQDLLGLTDERLGEGEALGQQLSIHLEQVSYNGLCCQTDLSTWLWVEAQFCTAGAP